MQKRIINLLIIGSIVFIFINKYITLCILFSILLLYNFKKKEIDSKEVNSDIIIPEQTKAQNQIEIFNNKKKILDEILTNEFGATSITFIKFNDVIENAKKVFEGNIAEINRRLNLIDIDEVIKYRNVSNENFKYIHSLLSKNDDIIKKIDKLIIEISNLDSTINIETLYSMEELKLLTSNVKQYRRN